MTHQNNPYDLQLGEDIKLTIHARKTSGILLGFFLFFALLILLTPAVAVIIFISIGEGIQFGFLITCILSVLSSGYLLRLYLWNKYGKEVFVISNEELILYYDYKFFKDNYQKIHFESIQVCCDPNEICDSVICFNLDGKIIKSKREIPFRTILKIEEYVSCF